MHLIDLQKDTTEKIFPIKDTEDKIIFISMTDDYLIYSDSKCHVKIFAIAGNCNIVGDYKFDHVIKKIFPNDNGTKYICIDELGKVLVYSPVTETVLQIYDELPGNFNRAIWDKDDPNVFIGIDNTNTKVYSFNLILNSLQGPYIRTLKEMDYLEDLDKEKVNPVVTTLENGSYPFLLESGSLFVFHKQDKETSNIILNSHYW